MVGDLKPYLAMKDSGVPWLGEVPEHWDVRRTKTLLRERVQKRFPDEPLLAATQTKGVVRKDQYENRTVLALKDLHLLKLVRVGDFVISLRSFQGGIEYAREQGIISPAYTVLYPAQPETHGFLAWLFKSKPYIENLSLYVTGIRQGQNIDYEKLSRSELPSPPLPEQSAIVRFLDHADRRIRHYIRAKQKLIKLLEEQKQAIIHRVVTRGLDPNVRLKPSGVRWLGDVPEHWDVRKLGQIAKVFNGATPSRMQPAYWQGGTIPWLSSGKVNDYFVETPSELVTEQALRECSISLVPRGSVIVGLIGQGKTRGMSALLAVDACINQNLAALVPRRGLDGRFLHHLLTAHYKPIREIGRGGNQEALNCDLVARLRLPIAPLHEQATLCRHLEIGLSHLVRAHGRVEREISLLREYRTRLIADVVTGKLDVREAAAHLPDEADEPEAHQDADTFTEGDNDTDEADLDAVPEEAEA